MRKLLIFINILLGCIFIGGVLLFISVVTTQNMSDLEQEDRWQLSDKPYKDDIVIYTYPPVYYQKEAEWASVPYGSSTIEEGGCGLCVAATIISYYAQKPVTPPVLLSAIGETLLVSEFNDLNNARGIFETYNIDMSEIYWTHDQAYKDIMDYKLVIAGVKGEVGTETYASHVVMLYFTNNNIQLFDPANRLNNGLTLEEFQNADFVYFYSVEKGVENG